VEVRVKLGTIGHGRFLVKRRTVKGADVCVVIDRHRNNAEVGSFELLRMSSRDEKLKRAAQELVPPYLKREAEQTRDVDAVRRARQG
jgi:hypothetical protein